MGKSKKHRGDPYSISSLREWFDLDTWEPKEAVCLICNFEPIGANIDWEGYRNRDGVHIPLPKVIDVTILGEEVKGKVEKIVRGNHITLQNAEKRLQKVWRLFERDPANQELSRESPQYYIDWAKRKKIDIPWLNWAEENALVYIYSAPDRDQLYSGGTTWADVEYANREADTQVPPLKVHKGHPPSKPIKAVTKADRKRQVEELRRAAVDEAILLKRDGLPDKHITVRKICRNLLDKGRFSTGDPFISRWRTENGMKSQLKSEHHPKASPKFKNSLRTETKFNS